ncbi:MAG: class II aldolase/adducin family protein [Chlorobi bacterium]|nr:class II aldolase/adducin family protein [Chlorobiota bacterium]
MTEGYIKFDCRWSKLPVEIPEKLLTGIVEWRNVCFRLDLIGADNSGIGFGNISAGEPGKKIFYITGSATGIFPEITGKHISRVDGYSFVENNVFCSGQVKASAETLTHAAIYEADPDVHAVIHVHHRKYWQALMGQVPATAEDITYGTPEMAEEIFRLFRETEVHEKKTIVMGGHPDGIITFGKDLDEAGAVLLAYINHIESL